MVEIIPQVIQAEYSESEKLYLSAVERLEREINSLRDNEDDYKKTHRIEFFEPFWYQQKFLDLIRIGKKTVLIQGSNRIGKSDIVAVCAGSFSLGFQPWDGSNTIFGSIPVKGRIICVDYETEILTEKGWLKRDSVKKGMNVMTVNPNTLKAEWGAINKIIDNEDDVFHFKNGTYDAMATKDHRWLVRNQTTGGKYKYFIRTTENLRYYDSLPLTINYEKNQEAAYNDDYIKLLAWIFTEGNYNNGKYIYIYQSRKQNPEKCKEIESLILNYCGELKKWENPNGCNIYRIRGDKGSKIKLRFPNKMPDWEFIISLSKRQLRIFYKTLIDGDGTRQKCRDVFYCKSKEFSDLFQAIALMLGYRVTWGYDNRKNRENYYIYSSYSGHNFTSVGTVNPKKSGKRKVWCVSTDNGIVVMRRHGSPFITGNCQDWEKHAATVMVPKLKMWLPAGTYKTDKNNVGIEAYWNFPETGSTIELITNKQETSLHEGWNGHYVIADEPPDRDKYIANKRGLIDYHGIFLLAMTAVKESWVLDEIVRNTDPSFASITGIKMRDNPLLKEEAIREFEASCDEVERLARVEGGWLNLVGLIHPGFELQKHLVDDFKWDPTWPVVAMIDHHTAKPHAISFFGVDPRENIFHIDDFWENGGPDEVANIIIRKKANKDEPWRIEHAFIDPLSKGDTENIKRMGVTIEDSFTRIKNKLSQYDIQLHVASKDKKSGIDNINSMLKGPNKLPTIFYFRNVANKIKDRLGKVIEGTVWEMQRWRYDDKGDPVKENDHFMENQYRMTLTGIKYTEMQNYVAESNTSDYDVLNYGIGGR